MFGRCWVAVLATWQFERMSIGRRQGAATAPLGRGGACHSPLRGPRPATNWHLRWMSIADRRRPEATRRHCSRQRPTTQLRHTPGTPRDPHGTTGPAHWDRGSTNPLQGARHVGEAARVRDLRRPHARADRVSADDARRHGLAVRGARVAGVPVPPRRPRLRRHAAAAVARPRVSHRRPQTGALDAPRRAFRSAAARAAGLVHMG